MAYETLLVETRGKVGLVTLNRPQALNALSSKLMRELNAALDGFEADRGIGCIVITGSEKAFAAGADIKEMQTLSFPQTYLDDFITAWDRVGSARKPLIAAVAGFALGGGCELAMMCDIIIAADNAKFGQPEIKLGVMPGAGGTQRLTRVVGKSKAMEMCLTGRMMDAEEAERSGLVARVVPAAELMAEAMKTAEIIAGDVPAHRHDDEGEREPGLRDDARRGHPLRAAPVPRHVRHGRPEGGHGRLRREARAELQEPLTVPAVSLSRVEGQTDVGRLIPLERARGSRKLGVASSSVQEIPDEGFGLQGSSVPLRSGGVSPDGGDLSHRSRQARRLAAF